jgi:hypothetical protein
MSKRVRLLGAVLLIAVVTEIVWDALDDHLAPIWLSAVILIDLAVLIGMTGDSQRDREG